MPAWDEVVLFGADAFLCRASESKWLANLRDFREGWRRVYADPKDDAGGPSRLASVAHLRARFMLALRGLSAAFARTGDFASSIWGVGLRAAQNV